MSSSQDSAHGEHLAVGVALRAGFTRAYLDRAEFERPFHGIRSTAPGDPESMTREERIERRALQYATRMGSHEFFSHRTSAVLWGLPLPLEADGPIDVAVFAPGRLPRGRNVRGHQVPPALASVTRHPDHAVRLASPASTWAMLGSVLRHPYDLIAVGDAIVRTPQHPDDPVALATLERLSAAVDAGRRVGVLALRAALPSVRIGSSSRPETWTRMTLIDAGLPEPVLAHEVFDASGGFLARIDMAYPRRKIAIEYEGAHHLTDGTQWTKDIKRYELLAAAGWTVIRVTKDELFSDPGSLIERVRRALGRASV